MKTSLCIKASISFMKSDNPLDDWPSCDDHHLANKQSLLVTGYFPRADGLAGGETF